MIKRVFFLLCAVCAIAACDGNGGGTDGAVLHCGEYDVAISDMDIDKISASINGDAIELTHVVAASGARYDGSVNDTGVTLWQKGENWLLILDDDMVIECAAK